MALDGDINVEQFFAEKRRTLRDPAHEAFCRAYVQHKDANKAWRVAYNKPAKKYPSAKRLDELLSDPSICRRIQFIQEMAAEKTVDSTVLSESYVIDGMKDLFERSMQIVEVVDRHGEALGQFKFDSGGAGKALDMMAKTAGLYREKRQASDTENQTDEQLLESVRVLSKQLGNVAEAASATQGAQEPEAGALSPIPEAN